MAEPDSIILGMVEISKATAEDLEWILSELQQFSDAYGTKKPVMGSQSYVRPAILNLIENHVFLIARKDGQRAGLIAGYYVPHPFNPELKLLSEQVWWVSLGFRNGKVGLKLLDAFVDAGKSIADWVTLSVRENENDQFKRSPFDRRGFQSRERMLLLEVA